MRYRCAHDANHKDVTAVYRKAGVWFRDVSSYLGFGCDLIARHRDGYIVAIEIKDPAKPPSARKLKPSEAELMEAFPNFFRIVLDERDALAAVGFEAPF